MNTISDRLERPLDPEAVAPSLFLATMFITTFEVLKDSIVDRLKGFYTDGWDESGAKISSEYEIDVASRNKSLVYASLAWLQENGVIDEDDLATFERLKKIRNLLAHQLFAVVTGQVESTHESQFSVLMGLLHKIEVWWVVNLEIPTNPDFEGEEIDEEGIVPGSILALQMLIQVASGNTELLEHWRKARVQEHSEGREEETR